ncbi:hypothetical protein GCM10011584_29500 [Nocardioides phosphati]|uniref:Uncharacterized protein n=1 Tax=Nocardioides phosphati TaxID=1867775 RepID=A0ABQ2ND20_9ACTN|nr:hypothetical protein [Nocardioides phosphati]GGO92638.1 hypothetical protein GCM10011584_29500 [Nocardioides phosphati]
MTWLALLLTGVAVTDLAHSVLQRHVVPQCVGALAAVALALLAGLTSTRDVVALVLVIVAVLAWGYSVSRGFAAGGRAWVPLTVLAVTVTAAVATAPLAPSPPTDGLVERWLDAMPWPLLDGVGPERALLLVALMLVQLSTGNVVVRLVLAATGTVLPAQHGTSGDPEMRLKGGRLLGPMERLVIFGLGLVGELTAAGIVIAAKGLLRFPELQSKGEQERIHQLTEYFLVGSFVSWLVPLASLVLLA